MNGKDMNCATYGRLYTFETALLACNEKERWRLPSDEDWMQLERGIGMPDSDMQIKAYTRTRGRGMGTKLKEGLFKALPAGYWNRRRKYDGFGDRTYWWSSTEGDTGKVIRRRVNWVVHTTKVRGGAECARRGKALVAGVGGEGRLDAYISPRDS